MLVLYWLEIYFRKQNNSAMDRHRYSLSSDGLTVLFTLQKKEETVELLGYILVTKSFKGKQFLFVSSIPGLDQLHYI